MNNIKTICVRFNLTKPLHKRAYELLQSQTEFPSNSRTITTTIVDYFENQKRENRLVEKIKFALLGFTPAISQPIIEDISDDKSTEFELDFDFLGG